MINESKGNQPHILVKLFATLREGRSKTVDFPYHEGLTTGEIIDALNIPLEDVSILLVNGRSAETTRVLTLGDYVSIFPPVGGG